MMRSLLVLALATTAAEAAPTVNLSFDPVSPIFGLFDGAATYGASEHVAVSGAISSFSLGSATYGWGGLQVSASAPLFFQQRFSGPYVEPGIVYRTFEHRSIDSGSNYGYGDKWGGVEVLFGWQWTADSGVNFALAGGVVQHVTGTHRTVMGSSSISGDADLNAYARAGIAF